MKIFTVNLVWINWTDYPGGFNAAGELDPSIEIVRCTDPTAAPPVQTTIFSTKITIDQDERTTETATPTVLDGAQIFAIDDLYRINIDAAGSGAADLTIGMKATI